MSAMRLGPVFVMDHQAILGRLDGLLAMETSAAQTASAFRQLAEHLRRHMHSEDRKVFPVFEESTGLGLAGPTILLRREHREIDNRLDLIATIFDAGTDRGRIRPELIALKALLEDHSRREETVLYAVCEQVLDSAQQRVAIEALSVQPDMDKAGGENNG